MGVNEYGCVHVCGVCMWIIEGVFMGVYMVCAECTSMVCNMYVCSVYGEVSGVSVVCVWEVCVVSCSCV